MLPEYMQDYPRRADGSLLPLELGDRILIYRRRATSLKGAQDIGLKARDLFTLPPEREDDKPTTRSDRDPGRGCLVVSESRFHAESGNVIPVACTGYKPKDRERKNRIPFLLPYEKEGYGVHFAELNTFPIDHEAIIGYRWKDPDARKELDRLDPIRVQSEIYPKIYQAFRIENWAGKQREFRPFPQGALVYVSFGSNSDERVPCLVLSPPRTQNGFSSYHRITVVQTVQNEPDDINHPLTCLVLNRGQFGLLEPRTAVYYLIRTIDATASRNICPVSKHATDWDVHTSNPRIGLTGRALHQFLRRVGNFIWSNDAGEEP